MMFYTGAQLPGARGDAFVAYHGSWNRSKKSGYCVTRVRFENGHPWGEQVYVNFLTPGGEALGRPVDVAQAPDGSLLITRLRLRITSTFFSALRNYFAVGMTLAGSSVTRRSPQITR